MREISNTAKAQMIEYLTQLFLPHQEAINALFVSARETVEGFIADSSEEIANITVTATECSSMINICISAELNERSGLASLFICPAGYPELMSVHAYEHSEGAILAGLIANALKESAEFAEYAKSISAQYALDYAPFCSYLSTIKHIKKSFDTGN